MGNSQTKESRAPHSLARSRSHQWSPSSSGDAGRSPYGDNNQPDGSRPTRGSRPDLSIFGIGTSDRDTATLEPRRETKQEREARRLEKERAARAKERERSMREEHVDGGYLVTQGVYVGPEDFNRAMVRQLMIERRLAPFWKGLNEFSDSWTEHQLMAAARGMPIPPPDEIPPELEYKNPPKPTSEMEPPGTTDIQHLTVPITSRSQSNNSDISQLSGATHSLPSAASPIASGTSSSPLFRTRAKTLAALTTPSKSNAQSELNPREIQLPRDPFVNGQPIEAYLYKDATECPICFLYYPPYLNHTRCCDQPICSECFVQIKRPDPHAPDHVGNDQSDSPEGNGAEESQLVSEPATCPFCVQVELGVTYAPPPFRRGLTYASDLNGRPNGSSAMSSTSSLSLGNVPATNGRRRATSLSANDPAVVTTDKIRPDWAQKLASARAHAARRSAAATALHTAAYLMNSNQSTSDSRSFSIGRRGVMRRAGATGSQTPPHRTSPALNALAFLTDRRAQGQEGESAEEGPNLAPPRGSSRRNRVDDLEDMMMMEAIRLSLASEEERRKKEEKEIRKEMKRREKEAKKADKAARKNLLHSNNASSVGLDGPVDGRSGKVASSSSSVTGGEASTAGKGKGVERVSPQAAVFTDQSSGTSSGQVSPVPPTVSLVDQDSSTSMPGSALPPAIEPLKQSHLRYMSSASSSHSSLVESSDERTATSDGNQTCTESMFNFRSLAAVIGDEDKRDESAEHVEHPQGPQVNEGSSSDTSPPTGQVCANAPDPEESEGTEANGSAQESQTIATPKELEARSVELSSPAPNAETQS